jgi:hypothetical protein
MFNYIENLKSKPEHVKKRFAFIVSFSFTFLVFAGWIASYGFTSSSAVVASVDSNGNIEKAVVEAPVSSLGATAIGAWNDLKNMILGSNKTEYSQDAIEISGGKR